MGVIRYECEQSVTHLELSNPKRGNALDFDMLEDLDQLLEQLEHSEDVNIVLLSADPACRHFCTGADIAAWSGLLPERVGPDWIDWGNHLFDRLAALPMPTLSAVHGLCLGGGLELALATDLIFASEQAAFSFPEVSIGVIPGWKGGVRLSERIGTARTRQMVFTGERVDAQCAFSWGLVNNLLATEHWQAEAMTLARKIAEQPATAMRQAKRLLPHQSRHWPDSAEHGAALQTCILARQNMKEE